MQLEEYHGKSQDFHEQVKPDSFTKKKGKSCDDSEEMSDDVGEEIAAGLANEDLTRVVKDTPIVEANSDLKSEYHS